MTAGYIEGAAKAGTGMVITSPAPVVCEQRVNAYLLDTAEHSMNVDGSSTAKTYLYTVGANKALILEGIHIVISDTAIDPAQFGALAKLTNGVTLDIFNAASSPASVVDLDGGKALKDLHNIAAMSDGMTVSTITGASNDLIDAIIEPKWPLYLPAGYSIRAKVQDDLTGLVEFYITIHGLLVDAA